MLLCYYSIDPGTVKAVSNIAEGLGASKAELAALERLEGGHGLLADFDRLAPLAMAAGIPWEPKLQRLDTEGERAALSRLLDGCTNCDGTGITMPPDMGLCGCVRNNLIFYIGALHGLESKLRRLEKKYEELAK